MSKTMIYFAILAALFTISKEHLIFDHELVVYMIFGLIFIGITKLIEFGTLFDRIRVGYRNEISPLLYAASSFKSPLLVLALACIYVTAAYISKSPYLLLLTMTIIGTTPLLTLVPPHWRLASITSKIFDKFIHILNTLGFLSNLFYIYKFFFFQLTFKGFMIFYSFIGLGVLFYVSTARYIFILQISHEIIPDSLIICYYIGIIFVIIRFLINFSLFVIPHTLNNLPEERAILAAKIPDLGEGGDGPHNPPPNNPSNNSSASGSTNRWFSFSLFGRHSHNHYHNYPYQRAAGIRYIGLGLTLGTLGVASYAAYHSQIASAAAVRNADATAVQAGLISKDEYYKRHPEDKPTK